MIEIRIPQASMEITEGELEEWLVEDGSAVTEGDLIYTLATDKVSMDVEAPATGTIRIIGVEGQTYDVGELIGHVEQ
ncbi:lipoyl domain-containing protein [Mycolicibacterium sp. P9-22]|uniref:lipoyl domain-containing protein n=1 Tax=Mycolicibacterium sp. P9-22 TaxID=2024613 RepID=UPI0011EBA716|nr:lipoyl domain-containing protein [Mycolicibacterium sp. P9-22]KAA0120645.1 dihydrolipoamide acyltransferase [Mycolicibacterium sp. P9-22]